MGELEKTIEAIINDEVLLGKFMDKDDNEVHLMNYYKSWDGLHTVIDKINGMGKGYNVALFKTYISISVETGGKVYKDFSFAHSENITTEQSPMNATFKALVKFVKWYNENNK